jgi:hypothetical protein
MQNTKLPPKLLHLNPVDNVAVAIEAFESIPFGHKCAVVFIASGTPIIKCGIVIGEATEDIPVGAHVHLHNMKSTYLPTYTLNDAFDE